MGIQNGSMAIMSALLDTTCAPYQDTCGVRKGGVK